VIETAPDSVVPLLSVLCITYNQADYIGDALDSFLAQVTDFDVEIVVSDDCSTDATPEILESYRQRLGGKIRVLRSPVNLGVTRNFRRAMNACRGRYIALCEGDDFWRGQRKLQLQVEFLEANSDFVIAYHNATLIGPEVKQDTPQLPRRLRCDASSAELIAARPISTLTACFRNVIGDLPNELDQAPALDLCLWSLLGHHGKGKYLEAIEAAAYRVHAGGVFSMHTERNRYLMTAQTLLCLARVYSRSGKSRISDAILLKAVVLAGTRLGVVSGLKLVATISAWLFVRPFLLLWKWLSGRVHLPSPQPSPRRGPKAQPMERKK